MAVEITCPKCGFVSGEVRCPRCNALKLVGCTGSCRGCGAGAACVRGTGPLTEGRRPSDFAREDAEHPGTPLER